ncbi:restriction endonuclease subunit S [Rhodoferax sp.]|uniref:restriction endonuclease subunit S n=1 Tax=Rhodoferax sp. TaxID=50421 RepID=UPI00374D7DDF
MWRELPLSDLAEITSGGTPSRDVAEYWGGDIPWVTPTDITACRTNSLSDTVDRITKRGLLNSAAKVLPVGTILFTSRATVGVSRIAVVPVSTNQGFKSLTALSNVDNRFLFYQVQRLRGAFERYAAGSTFPEINKKDTARVLIPHPVSRFEQRKIAAILTSLDTAIEKTEALIAKYQQIKAGLMHDLFTHGVLPDGSLRPPREQAPELYQETATGWIPKEWTTASLKNICLNIIDCPHSTPTFAPSGILVARTMHIKDGIFLEEAASRVSEQDFNERNARSVPTSGDVILTREAPVGEAFVIPNGMRICLGQRVMLIKPNPTLLDANYLVAQIYSGSLSARISDLTAGTTNPHLNVADVRTLSIELPHLPEQKLMTMKIKGINEHIQIEKRTMQKLQYQKLGLMQDLLTGKVPVKVEAKEAELA